MDFNFLGLFPADLSLVWIVGLTFASFLTSALTAALGLGGGMTLLAILTLVFPPLIVVPVHGAVQLGSNAGRAFLRRAHVQWPLVLWFTIGSAIGAYLGGQVAVALPQNVLLIMIAVFILANQWLPLPELRTKNRFSTTFAGAITSGTSMFVGISGPLVMLFLKHLPDRREIIATHATLMSGQNLFKIATFMLLGFAFHTYLALILLMVMSGFVGTKIGSNLSDRMSEQFFRTAFRFAMTVLAIHLLWRAFS